MNGKSPSSGAPTAGRPRRVRRRRTCSSVDRAGRHDERAARSCAGRGAAGGARARASANVTRAAHAALLDQAQERLVEILRAGPRAQLGRRRRASRLPSRRSRSASQRVGLVHHVARDEQRRAAVGERVEELPRGRGGAPGRARPSARRARAAPGWPSSAVASETRARWPPESRATTRLGLRAEADRRRSPRRPRCAAAPRIAREEARGSRGRSDRRRPTAPA